MSKELEALERLVSNIGNSTLHAVGGEDWMVVRGIAVYIDIIEEALKRNEPMKPKYEKDGTRSCPICHANWLTPNFKYCSDCGQKLDWGE